MMEGLRWKPGKGAFRFSALFLLLWVASACGADGTGIQPPVPFPGGTAVAFPLELWEAGIEGETELRVRVTDTGRVDSVEVVTPSGQPAFDSAAVAGASAFRFSPAVRNGDPVRVWTTIPIRFQMGNRPNQP